MSLTLKSHLPSFTLVQLSFTFLSNSPLAHPSDLKFRSSKKLISQPTLAMGSSPPLMNLLFLVFDDSSHEDLELKTGLKKYKPLIPTTTTQ